MADEPLLTGRDENTPFRAHARVVVVIAIVVAIVLGIAYGLYAAFGGKQHGSTLPVPYVRA